MMNVTEIRKYAKLMQELGLTALEITEDARTVRLERSVPVQQKEIIPVDTTEPAACVASEKTVKNQDEYSVTSPLVGLFYAAPAENAEPYVSIGDHVKKGQTLCIIEAMKLMNEITAEEDGVISDICVTNGQVVEYGTELFRIKRYTDEQR